MKKKNVSFKALFQSLKPHLRQLILREAKKRGVSEKDWIEDMVRRQMWREDGTMN